MDALSSVFGTKNQFQAHTPVNTFQATSPVAAGTLSQANTQAFARPAARLDPYSTSNPRIFLCSASTPPGGSVHGMCGYHAARSVLRRIDRLPAAPLR